MVTHHLAVIIATLNAAGSLPACLTALSASHPGLRTTLIVADGGSTDETQALAVAAGCLFVTAPPGRAAQYRKAADAARDLGAEFFWFLHADTVPDAGWGRALADFMAGCDAQTHAGYGRLCFDDRAWQGRLIAWLAHGRGHLGLPYGDQGLLIAHGFYVALGGYPETDFMEDVLMVRKIGRRRLRCLSVRTTTSAIRYRRDGWFRRASRNLLIIVLFLAGVPPARLKSLYTLSPRR